MGIACEWNKKLIGFGCDGTRLNIGDRGLKIHTSAPDSPWIGLLVPCTLTGSVSDRRFEVL